MLMFSGSESDSGDTFKVYLVFGEARGRLEIRLANGPLWTTQIDLEEIVLFRSNRTALLELYLNEMVLNARAATRERVH